MKIERFDIEFCNAEKFEKDGEPIYYPGQTIVFKVVIDLVEPVKCSGIDVAIEGKASIIIKTKNSSYLKTLQTYLDQKSTIFTPPSEGPTSVHHPAGHAEYQFAFQLPEAIPPSFFEEEMGGIYYSIGAILNRPWRLASTASKTICVIRSLYLDRQPVDKVGPYSGEAALDARAGCGLFSCTGGGQIQASIQLDRRGYVCGEPINIRGELRNGSCRDVDKITIEIRRKLKFSNKSTQSKVVAAILVPAVKANNTVQLNYQLPVPAGLSNSGLEGCSSISLNYYLIVHAHNKICPVAKKLFCELIIGDVKDSNQHHRLMQQQQQQQQQQMNQQQQMYQQQQQMYQQAQPQFAMTQYAAAGPSTKYEFDPAYQQALQQSQWIPGYPALPSHGQS